MLMGNTSLHESASHLSNEFTDQIMEVSNLLVRRKIRVIDYEMDPRWIPELLDPHLPDDLDRQGPSTILCHSKVDRQGHDISRMEHVMLAAFGGTDAHDLLREGE